MTTAHAAMHDTTHQIDNAAIAELEAQLEANFQASEQAHRLLLNGTIHDGTTFDDLPAILKQDAIDQQQVALLRTELDTLAQKDDLSQAEVERFIDATQEFMDLDFFSYIAHLETESDTQPAPATV